MLGILRFSLAMLVLTSHIPGNGFRLNLGISAVIVFYFISGVLMHGSYQRFQQNSPSPIRSFYVDRLLKLFPIYLLVVLLSFIAVAFLGPARHTLFMDQTTTPLQVLLNALLLPTNYIFDPVAIKALGAFPAVPPAWSLATEFHFYLLLPLIAALKPRAFVGVLCISTCIQTASLFFAHGAFNSNNFGYRFVFGVLTFFLFGYAYARRATPFYLGVTGCLLALYLGILLVMAPSAGLYQNPYVQELLLGAVMALPLTRAALDYRPIDKHIKRLDEAFGRLAYPVFVSHFLVFFLCEKALLINPAHKALYVPTVILGSLLLSVYLMYLQSLLERYRIRRRGFPASFAYLK
ncbi:MAG: acyltransferase [Pseudomonadota bacterium]